MKKVLIFISIMLFLVPGLVHALPWQPGDSISVNWDPSYVVSSGFNTYGGLAIIKNNAKGGSINTFCIELNEYTSSNMEIYEIDDDYALKGGRGGAVNADGDPLSGATKWLYEQYLTGNITGNNNIKALALAIWYLEDEYVNLNIGGTIVPNPSPSQWAGWYGGSLSTIAQVYIEDAIKHHSGYTNSQILVLDTYNVDPITKAKTLGQSFLYHVPEPASMLLLGLGLLGIGLVSRKKS